METTGIIGVIEGLYRDYTVTLGLYRANGKEHGNYHEVSRATMLRFRLEGFVWGTWNLGV